MIKIHCLHNRAKVPQVKTYLLQGIFLTIKLVPKERGEFDYWCLLLDFFSVDFTGRINEKYGRLLPYLRIFSSHELFFVVDNFSDSKLYVNDRKELILFR